MTEYYRENQFIRTDHSAHGNRAAPADADAIERMAEAGQALARKWGHSPWSDSWGRLVAETMLVAISTDWRCECGDLNRDHEAGCYRCGAGRDAS